MTVYESYRTKDVISRLVRAGNTARLIFVVMGVILIGLGFSFVGLFLFGGGWWIFTIFGVAIGYGLGVYLASLVVVALEGLAQMLVAQDEILAAIGEKD